MHKANDKTIRKYLSQNAQGIKIETVDVVDSTNDEMKRRALMGEKEISLLIAEAQTKGKGTRGRFFHSPEGTGIYMSFLLRPSYTPSECTLLTTMAAVCTAEAIEKVTGRKTNIKWVNDIYIENRKASGILTQSHFSSDGKTVEWSVVGIGINITEPEGGFPEEIRTVAGAVGDSVPDTKNRIIAEIINSFYYYYPRLREKTFRKGYSDRLLWRGGKIKVTLGDKSYEAILVDIDEDFRLKVKLTDGSEIILESADISAQKTCQ